MGTRNTEPQLNTRLIKRVKAGIESCIKIDIDKRVLPKDFEPRLFNLLGTMCIVPEWIRYDKTPHGWHVIIKHKGFAYHLSQFQYDIATMWAQAILGSDPKREAYNFKRWQHGIILNQLFEPNT